MGGARGRRVRRDDQPPHGSAPRTRRGGPLLHPRGRAAGRGAGRDREDAVPHGRRTPRRGRPDALPRWAALAVPLVAVRLSAHLHVLRNGSDAVRPEPDGWEILDQALHFRRIESVDHAVFMGMGEPMLNLDAVLEAARTLPDVGITHRRATVSTVAGWPGC